MNKIGAILLSVIAVGAIQFFMGCPIPFLHHNYLMARFKKSVEEIPLPSNTAIIGISSYFGIMYGNGNKCDAIVGALIQSGKSDTEIYSYFNNLDIELQAPWGEINGRFHVFQVIDQQYYAISKRGRKLVNFDEYEDDFEETFWKSYEIQFFDREFASEEIAPHDNYYLVIVRDLGQQNSYNLMDFRCN